MKDKMHEIMLRKIFRASSIIIAISLLVTSAGAGEEARLFEQGRQELQAKEFSRAVRSFERVLALSPEYGEGWTEFNLGIAYYGIKDWGKAASYFEKAHQRNPKKFSTHVYYYRNLGYSLFRQGKNEQALSIYEEGLKRFPEDEWLLEMAGWSLQRLGRKRESVSCLKKSASIGFPKIQEGKGEPPVFQLPFEGRWKMTRGNGSKYTHIGLLGSYSWDFAVVDSKGKTFSGKGELNDEYFAFNQPILAPEDGIVVEVEFGIADNKPDNPNYPQPWGNYVRIQHSKDLFTVLVHLKQDGVSVHPGQRVKKGQLLGRLGNSGNSTQPHLHFHCEYGDENQRVTRPCRFEGYPNLKEGDVVRR